MLYREVIDTQLNVFLSLKTFTLLVFHYTEKTTKSIKYFKHQ